MPDDQKPMDWEEADIWWDELCVSLPLMDRGLPDVHSQDAIFRAIALARQERERAERAEAFSQSCSDDLAFLDKVRAENKALKARADRLAAAVEKYVKAFGSQTYPGVAEALRDYRDVV